MLQGEPSVGAKSAHRRSFGSGGEKMQTCTRESSSEACLQHLHLMQQRKSRSQQRKPEVSATSNEIDHHPALGRIGAQTDMEEPWLSSDLKGWDHWKKTQQYPQEPQNH